MITFKTFLVEGYKNLFDAASKKQYAQEAFVQLQQSYAAMGGIKGSGFADEEDFVKNIPFWKLKISPSTGKLIAGAYYKDTAGRKRVAISSDGSKEAKVFVADIMVNDLTQGRAFTEQSGSSLKFLVKTIGYDALKKHAIPFSKIENILDKKVTHPEQNDPELIAHPELKSFLYSREIGHHTHTKIALGTPNKKIT